MAEVLFHVVDTSRINGLHGNTVFQNVRVPQVRRDAGGRGVALHDAPKGRSMDVEYRLIKGRFGGVFSQSLP